MNATVGITQKQFDDWQDDVSPWAPTMFTSPFGENMQPVPDPHFWGSPGNSSEEYCRTNSQSTGDDLRHSFDAADNFETGYTINAVTRPPAGSDHDALGYDYHHRHSVAQMTGLSDPRQAIDPFAPRGRHHSVGDGGVQNFGAGAADDEGLFDDSLTSSTVASPSALRSPAGSWDWTGATTSPTTNPTTNATGEAGAGERSTTTTRAAGAPPTKSRRNRERNRVAAHKCRQKAKQSMTDLQARERELSRQNRMLQEHAGSLRDEILDLKNEILRHSECNSDIIQNYIARAARDVN
ncbi:uncharacterized protein F4807DRAFT_108322 [Annulohypoxylon truncatum]|uniref:uncharacterized protein n=1 Tax=Annulohypoxylon truncatum TaxID=327061 RepID=UPI002007F285|nr:uncharacterized protein F4807DRAFT_108322 [Annulohypoxylon truncatum]KAI1209034.1 hypothetical protein F4807DRAFT_108322 [Annulohypoxylon truncatum]